MSIRSAINRLPVDRFLLMMIATIALAAFLPARGQVAEAFDWVVFGAIALLFFLYGARISPQAVWAGFSIGGCKGSSSCRPFSCFR